MVFLIVVTYFFFGYANKQCAHLQDSRAQLKIGVFQNCIAYITRLTLVKCHVIDWFISSALDFNPTPKKNKSIQKKRPFSPIDEAAPIMANYVSSELSAAVINHFAINEDSICLNYAKV